MISELALASNKWRDHRYLKRTTMNTCGARIGKLHRCGNALSPNERKRALTAPPTVSSGRSRTQTDRSKKEMIENIFEIRARNRAPEMNETMVTTAVKPGQ